MRKHFRQLRSQVDAHYRQRAAEAAALLLAEHPVFIRSRRVACYLPAKDEFDTSCIVQTIWKAGKQCYLPVLSGPEQNELNFVAYSHGDALHLNRYQIYEPVNIQQDLEPCELDLVITPLLAFDNQGGRLGMGGGFYDRTFAASTAESADKPVLFGLAYSCQKAESLPVDDWDVRLDGVLTEEAIISFS